MIAFVFPGQGAQFPGMGKDLYESSELAKELFLTADKILGFSITDVMFNGTEEDLRQTKVTQPAVFLHSVIISRVLGNRFNPDMVAGHSLGEFSAIVAAGALTFEEGLRLVHKRAMAMQKACEKHPSTMAAILGLEDKIVEGICSEIDDVVIPANYNSPGQIVISGSISGIEKAIEKLTAAGAKRALKLSVGGAFHSPFMESARLELEKAIDNVVFDSPICPVYQNVTARASSDSDVIKENLKKQLVSPVKWTHTIQQMIFDGATEFYESGPGTVLQGLIKKIDKTVTAQTAR